MSGGRGAPQAAADGRPAAVLAVLLAYLATRAPFYGQPLVSEEGIFAHLLAYWRSGTELCLVGRVGGQDLFARFDHPSGMYLVYSGVGALARAVLGWLAPENLGGVAWLRMAHSAFQGALWIALALAVGAARGRARVSLGAWALLMLSSPLGLGASLFLQTDSSSGTLLAGLAALALAFGVNAGGGRLAWAAFFAVGAVGKQEWSLCALAGLALGMGACRIRGKDVRAFPRLGWGCLASLAVGNALSFGLDPANYLGGLRVMAGLGGSHHLFLPGKGKAWLVVMGRRAPFVLPLLAAMLAASWLAWRSERPRGPLLACGLAWGCFLPYAASTWLAEHRYFAPAWAATLVGGAAALAQLRLRGRAAAALAVMAVGLTLWQTAFLARVWSRSLSVTEVPLLPLKEYAAMIEGIRERARRAGGCVPRLPVAVAWRRDGGEFIADSLGPEGTAAVLGPSGARACP